MQASLVEDLTSPLELLPAVPPPAMLDAQEAHRAFNRQTVGKRFAIVLAGLRPTAFRISAASSVNASGALLTLVQSPRWGTPVVPADGTATWLSRSVPLVGIVPDDE